LKLKFWKMVEPSRLPLLQMKRLPSETWSLDFDSAGSEQVFMAIREPCKLISIFGRGRRGKSFLLSALACEDRAFNHQFNELPVTKGADIFPLTDNQTILVDVEGGGVEDAAYDFQLMIPILLLSQVTIYNILDHGFEPASKS
jgi:hypothetical protein